MIYIDFFIDKLFPYRCILCHLKSDQKKDLCLNCQLELPWIKQGCHLCGQEIALTSSYLRCGKCLAEPPLYERFLALFHYTHPLISLIKQFKFGNKLIVGKLLGELLTADIRKKYQNLPLPQLLIPVPLHRRRLCERGYNQALELARVISKSLNIPLDYKNTLRHKNTASQTALSAEERGKNMKRAFSMRSPLKYIHVAIIDDVVTTGSTVTEFSSMLKKNGVQQIDVWCLAKTQRDL